MVIKTPFTASYRQFCPAVLVSVAEFLRIKVQWHKYDIGMRKYTFIYGSVKFYPLAVYMPVKVPQIHKKVITQSS